MSESEPWPPPVTERKKPLPFAGQPVGLPDLRKPQNSARIEQPCTRTRVHTRARSSRPTKRDAESLPRGLRTVLSVVGGTDLWFSQPPSLSQAWELHGHSARYFEAGLLRWPRRIWGVVHLPIAALIYLLVWITSTVPRALALGALIGLLVWWPF